MEVVVTKEFRKQLKFCPQNIRERTIKVIDNLEGAKSLQGIPNVKKIQGTKEYYRIRVGDYRIGFKYVSPSILIICILNRNVIYNQFP